MSYDIRPELLALCLKVLEEEGPSEPGIKMRVQEFSARQLLFFLAAHEDLKDKEVLKTFQNGSKELMDHLGIDTADDGRPADRRDDAPKPPART